MIAQGVVREALERPAELIVELEDGRALRVKALDPDSRQFEEGNSVQVELEGGA